MALSSAMFLRDQLILRNLKIGKQKQKKKQTEDPQRTDISKRRQPAVVKSYSKKKYYVNAANG
jgi:hypothetical protein